jgi:hypothetical protein
MTQFDVWGTRHVGLFTFAHSAKHVALYQKYGFYARFLTAIMSSPVMPRQSAAGFHVPSQELPRVLLELHATLKPSGVLLSSNPRGHNAEGWNGGRYGAYHDLETWRRYMSAAGFVELTHYYRPAGLPCEQQPWLASVWRKPAS